MMDLESALTGIGASRNRSCQKGKGRTDYAGRGVQHLEACAGKKGTEWAVPIEARGLAVAQVKKERNDERSVFTQG